MTEKVDVVVKEDGFCNKNEGDIIQGVTKDWYEFFSYNDYVELYEKDKKTKEVKKNGDNKREKLSAESS